jgi:hypothetical protein
MPQEIVNHPESVARAVALLIAANARVDSCELKRLDTLDAYERIGVSRARFMELAQACRDEVGERLVGHSWLSAEDIERIDRILDSVSDPQLRLLVCQLAAAVIKADGCVCDVERMVFDHMLGRWRVNRSVVGESMRADTLN